MECKRYNIILLAGFVAVILFFAVFRSINRSVEDQLEVQMRTIEEALPPEKPAPAPVPAQKREKQKHSLSPSDPSQYQITPQRESALFKNQRYWDVITKRALLQSDVIDRMREEEVFKGIEKTPEQFQKQLQKIDGRIRDYKEKVRNNPGDDYAQRKLQDLYMLKSTVKALEKTVVAGGGNNL